MGKEDISVVDMTFADINKGQMLNNMQMMEELKSRHKEQRRDYYAEQPQAYEEEREHNADEMQFVGNEYAHQQYDEEQQHQQHQQHYQHQQSGGGHGYHQAQQQG